MYCHRATNRTDPQYWLSTTLDVPLHLPNQTSTALLTTALILWLDYHSTGEIPNLDGPLVVTVNPLHVPTHNRVQHKVYTKKMDKYTTKHRLIARSGLSGNTQA